MPRRPIKAPKTHSVTISTRSERAPKARRAPLDRGHRHDDSEEARDFATDAEWKRHERFLRALQERGRRAATLDAYDKDWRTIARWYLDTTGQSFDLMALTPMDAADYRAFLVRTAKPATAARRLLFLRT